MLSHEKSLYEVCSLELSLKMDQRNVTEYRHLKTPWRAVMQGVEQGVDKFVSQHRSDTGSSPAGSISPLLVRNHSRCGSISCLLIL